MNSITCSAFVYADCHKCNSTGFLKRKLSGDLYTCNQCNGAGKWIKEFDPNTGNYFSKITLGKSGKFAIVDSEDFEWLSTWKWQYINSGYANRVTNVGGRISVGGAYVNIPMHRAITKCEKGLVVDHINGNKLDNRKENLRVCSHTQNLWNSSYSKRGVSGYRGVSWCNTNQKWLSLIICNGKRKQLGHFHCKHEAAKAYNQKAMELYGSFAKLNVIPDYYL
jgi:hypothetical protein